MPNPLTPDTLLDITHEALLRNWDKLQQWAYEEHEREIILREMLAQLDKWLKNNRDTQYLLSAGSLSYFEKWWTGIEVNKAMWMRRYLDGGIRADDLADKERKTQNAKQKKQEIEEYLSESRNYHNRKKRIQQIAIGIICVLLVTAVGGLIYSWDLKNKISVTSHSNAIATKAYRTLEKDPTLAFRLAEQAYKIAPEPLSKEVLMASYGEMPFYQVLRGHTAVARSCKFSHNGNLIITGSDDNNVIIWDVNGIQKMILKGHNSIISGPAPEVINFSPDDKLIVSASFDSTARLWEVSSGKCLAIMKHKRAVSSAVFSPDGTKILTASADKTAKLWDAKGKELVVFRGHTKGVKLAKFSPNGTKILTASGDSTARLWDLDGRELIKIKGDNYLYDANFSSNGKKIITGDGDKNVSIWDLSGKKILSLDGQKDVQFSNYQDYVLTRYQTVNAKLFDSTGKEISTLRGHTAKLWHLTFSSDSKQILTASDDGTARLWDLSGTELMVLKGHTDQVMSANFSPDGNYVVTASGDKTARIWNIKPKENPVLKGHTAYVMDANFSPDDKYVVTAGWDYTSKIWDKERNLVNEMNHLHYTVCQSLFSPDGKYILTTNYLGYEVRLWHNDGNLFQVLKHKGSISQKGIAFSHNGNYILTHLEDQPIALIWSFNDSARRLYSIHHSLSAEFSPDDNFLLASCEDSTVKIYPIPKEKKTDSLVAFIILKGHRGNVSGAWSPDGKNIVTSSDDSTARIWNLSGKCLYILKGHSAALTNAKYSPNGNHILTISQDNTIGIWDKDGKSISYLKGHNDIIQDANFSPDSKWIVSASNDNTYRLWDLMGNELMTYAGHKAVVEKAKFSPDGKYILTASDDHTARIMPVSIELVLDKINSEKVRGKVLELSDEELRVFGVAK